MSVDDFTIVAAKVTMLEQLVRALFNHEFRAAGDPAQTARDYGERLKSRMEQAMEGGPNDPATMLIVENIDLFFDVLVRELSAGQEPSQTEND